MENPIERDIRTEFFQSTFWSIYRHFPHVLVATSTDEEVAFLKSLQLHTWKTLNVMPSVAEKDKKKILDASEGDVAICV